VGSANIVLYDFPNFLHNVVLVFLRKKLYQLVVFGLA
jgi:hypothetical protein